MLQNIKEHILVCLSPSPSNKRIIDTAAKMAKAFGAVLTAIYVQKSENDVLPLEDEQRLQANIRFAKDCGAAIVSVIGENISYQIAEFARISGVTKIVIGRSYTRKYHFWNKPTVTEQLIDIAPDIDVYIIPDSNTNIKISNKNRFVDYIVPSWRDLLLTFALLAGVTLLGVVFMGLGFTESNIITVYILGVLINAIITKSHLCSLISSLCSVLLFNYFFTEPRLSFHAYEAGYTVTFIIMLIAALLTGTLANKLKDNAKQSAQAAFRTKVLFDTNQLLQKARTENSVIKVIAGQVILLLNKNVIIYPVEDNRLGNGYVFTSDGSGMDTIFGEEGERTAAKWVFENHRRAGANTKIYPDAKALYLAIRLNGAIYGVMGINVGTEAVSSFEYSILMSILGECALALENIKNERDKEEASIMAQNEKLRANLLRTISHDLRTPLTSILGNASNLCAHYKQMDDEMLEQIFSDIYDDSEWLINLVENLLSVTRIENGQLQMNSSVELVDDVIDEAIKHVDRNKIKHNLTVKTGDEMLLAEMDVKLIIQVIINIINNAIKYTQEGSEIVVETAFDNDWVYIRISDNGPGMDDDMKKYAFDMFYTGHNKVADSKRSMGLGLALCKAVVEAHHGNIEVTDNKPSGCIFTFSLKRGEVNLNE